MSFKIGSQKNLLEIELNERLRRQREELQAQLDALADADTGAEFSPDELEARVRELRVLNNSINDLQKKAAGIVFALILNKRHH